MQANQKIKKTDANKAPSVALTANPDILATIARAQHRPGLVIGFAAETENVIAHAKDKLTRKACDWIVANDVSGDVMGGDKNRVHLVSSKGVEDWPLLDKLDVGRRLAGRIADALKGAA